ncbi:hypothetical protein QCA50_011952 [Cerrena zonata]|uniref:Chitin synthase export chaperone n=1 Tax=Cerrena zonata TaxID=2478898 RepID=A0AAW0G564_9APHY
MTKFGDFAPLCHDTPSYPWCNLFYRQIQHHQSSVFTSVSSNPATAPVGINPTCGIPFVGSNGSLANIANIVACALSIFVVGALIFLTSRRRAAVGRVEFRIFLVLYWLTLPLQLLTTGSVLQQGSTALTVLTAIHAGFVAATFWALLGNAIVSTQVVEDGTLSSLIPFSFFTLAFFIAVTYISLDTAFSFTSVFGPSDPADSLNNIALFILTNIWPAAAAVIYFALMLYIILGILNELKPVWFYILAAGLFVLSQLDFFLLNKVICKGANQKIDGSFVATILETASVVVLYFGWKGITEEQWDDQEYAYYYGR